MSINRAKLSPLFRPSSLKAKQEQDALKVWKALFYTLRSHVWSESCKAMIADGKQTNFLKWDQSQECLVTTEDLYSENGELVLPKGSPTNEWFNLEKSKFQKEFDQAYIEASVKELAQELEQCYGVSFEEAMRQNEQRLAERYKR